MKSAYLPAVLSLLALTLLGFSGIGVRLALWPFPTGFQMLRWAVYLGGAAALLGLLGLLIPAWRNSRRAVLISSALLGLAVAALPLRMLQMAKSLPPIHDITTDTTNPPPFVAVLPLRANAPNSPVYAGAELAAKQRTGYPDLQPLDVNAPPANAFARALTAAKSLGWEIVASDPATGRIEATATTRWFGFKDDIVVRVAANGQGSRIDVRSESRVGASDVGTNAQRIRTYLATIRSEAG